MALTILIMAETAIQFSAVRSRSAKALTSTQNKITTDKGSKQLLAAYNQINGFCEQMQLGKNVSDASKFIVCDALFL
jgi:hypothetical protein